MKIFLTALILLAVTTAFAEKQTDPACAVTNSAVTTNANGAVKTSNAPAKTDAYTGATAKNKKQK